MKRTGSCSLFPENEKKIPKIVASDSLLANKVFGGCLPAMNRILDYVPEIFWLNLRGTTKPMKTLVEQRLSKLRVLNYPAEFPGKQELQELIEAEMTCEYRNRLVNCLFNHQNLLRFPKLETFTFPATTYSGFEEDFKYITECPKIKDITLPFLWDHPEHCESLTLKPCKSLKILAIHGCPDSLAEKYWDRLFSESVDLNCIDKASLKYVSPNFYRKLPLVKNLQFLTLNLCAENAHSEERLEQVKTEHKAVLTLFSDQSMRFHTDLDLGCLVSWHDRFIGVINENLERLRDLSLRFTEGSDDFEIMADRTLHFYLDLPIINLALIYELEHFQTNELVKIELRSGPNLKETLETLAIEVECDFNVAVNEPCIQANIFVQEFLRDCTNLRRIDFEDGYSETDVHQMINNLDLPKLHEEEEERTRRRRK